MFLSIGGLLETVFTIPGLQVVCSSDFIYLLLLLFPVARPHSFILELELLLVLLLARLTESIFLTPIRLGVLGESRDSKLFLFELLETKSQRLENSDLKRSDLVEESSMLSVWY